MQLKYEFSGEWTQKAREIAVSLDFRHVQLDKVFVIKSHGSKSRRTEARIHGLPKALQVGAGLPTTYVIELISKKFDKLPSDEQTKVIIHELLHIPNNFGGGFRQHDHVTDKNVNEHFKRLQGAEQTRFFRGKGYAANKESSETRV